MVEWVKWELLGVGGTAATATSKTSTNRSSKHYPVPCHQFDLIVGTAFSTAPLPSHRHPFPVLYRQPTSPPPPQPSGNWHVSLEALAAAGTTTEYPLSTLARSSRTVPLRFSWVLVRFVCFTTMLHLQAEPATWNLSLLGSGCVRRSWRF